MIVFMLFFFQAEDGIRDLVRSRGLGDVYKRQEFVAGEVEVPFLEIDLSELCAGSVHCGTCRILLQLSLIHI